MSSNFVGITFANQRVTPIADALVHRVILPDGILSGCEISYSGSTLTMTAGFLMACGRAFRHAVTQSWPVAGATSGFARLLLTIDLTRTATADSFDQIVDTIEYATAEDGFPALVQEDINASGTKYQVVACTVSLGVGGITGIVSRLGVASIREMLEASKDNHGMSILWKNPNPAGAFAAQTVALDLSGYDAVTVTAQFQTTGGPRASAFALIGEEGVVMPTQMGDNVAMRFRKFTVNESGVTFTNGAQAIDSSGKNRTEAAIPVAIYGIKGIIDKTATPDTDKRAICGTFVCGEAVAGQ